jgi:poly(3-hydroxybutyrate) depolymerase
MKRALLFFLCFILSAQIFSQTLVGRQQVITVNTGGSPATAQSLLWLPDTYSTDTSHYPLIIFLGGTGEQGSDINLLLNYGTLPYQISQGFNAEAVNPIDGKNYKFIVFSPQGPAGSWGWQCVPHLKTMLPQIEAQYRVDPNRVYVTGLSAGGWGTWSCITDDTTFCKGLAAIVPISSAAAQNPQYIGNAATYNVPVWTICGDQDAFWSVAQQYTATINALNPVVPMKLTDLPGIGHWAWDTAYQPTWYDPTDPQKKSIYSWMLQYSCANAGTVPAPPATNSIPFAIISTNTSITLPVDSVTLNGANSHDSLGTLISYQWNIISGPGQGTIINNSSAAATANNLAQGTYEISLTVTDNNNKTSSDTVKITVNPAIAPSQVPVAIIAGAADTTIVLPQNSIVLNGSNSYQQSGTIVSYRWTKISGPGKLTFTNQESAIATISNLVKGVYKIKLTVKNSNKSAASDTIQINVLKENSQQLINSDTTSNSENVPSPLLSVPTISTTTMYPNPATDILHVVIGQDIAQGKVSIIVYDEQGHALQTQSVNKTQSTQIQDINVAAFTRGIYFVRIIDTAHQSVLKLIKN